MAAHALGPQAATPTFGTPTGRSELAQLEKHMKALPRYAEEQHEVRHVFLLGMASL